MNLARVYQKYSEALGPSPARPVPKLTRHKLGLACVAYRVKGRRWWVYFGEWGSRAASVKYAAWARRWPAQLTEGPTAGRWPAVRLLTFKGRTQSLARWAAEFGLKPTTLRNRLDLQKLNLETALTTPVQRPYFARRVAWGVNSTRG